jgi:hypothetical protein
MRCTVGTLTCKRAANSGALAAGWRDSTTANWLRAAESGGRMYFDLIIDGILSHKNHINQLVMKI